MLRLHANCSYGVKAKREEAAFSRYTELVKTFCVLHCFSLHIKYIALWKALELRLCYEMYYVLNKLALPFHFRLSLPKC